jgi:hypothetical protein
VNRPLFGALAAVIITAAKAAYRSGTRTRSTRLAVQGAGTCPGRPRDGKPLSRDEERALSFVETDSWIRIPEPTYSNGETS